MKISDNEINIQEIMMDKYEDRLQIISKEYENQKEKIDNGFLHVFDGLFQRGLLMQQEGKKGKIAVISIFYLKSSILTENYDIQINLYDENFYMDRKDIYALWKPLFLMKYFESDIGYFKEKAMHNVVGFDYDKLQEFRMQYSELYSVLLMKYCMEKAEDIVNLETYKRLEKWEQTIITFGSYMDKGVCIYPSDIGKGEPVI